MGTLWNDTCESVWTSKLWRDTVLSCTQENRAYSDQDFPADTSSLYGRPQANKLSQPIIPTPHKNPYKKSTVVVERNIPLENTVTHCKCGLPASCKTVQSDGPNYGRPFLCCGRRPYSSAKSRCNFFQWSQEPMTHPRWSQRNISWFRVDYKPLCIQRGIFSYDDVQQGILLGNCWFLSALAVVAEKQYLIQRLIPTSQFNKAGCYQVNFYLDGCWESILIDSFLPMIQSSSSHSSRAHELPLNTSPRRKKIHLDKDMDVPLSGSGNTVEPVFAAWPRGVLWPAFVEKAYAKVHGSYNSLNGGFISEAFNDLTGAPTERMYLARYRVDSHSSHVSRIGPYHLGQLDLDELWVRLLSFSSANFIMGAASSTGGDGIVPCHAYSVLNIFEIHDAIQGGQQKLTDFYEINDDGKRKRLSTMEEDEVIVIEDDEVIVLENAQSKIQTQVTTQGTTTSDSIRLVHIRNPWGCREFKGSWSANSDKWTRELRKKVGRASFQHGDGTFLMSLDEFVTRFDHVDVSKCHEDWIHSSSQFSILPEADALSSASHYFKLQAAMKTWAFLTIIQPKKRANTLSRYWYYDISLLVLRRRADGSDWIGDKSVLQGVQRCCEIEIFLEPCYEYLVLPVSFGCSREEGTRTRLELARVIRFSTYSSHPLKIEPIARDMSIPYMNQALMLSSFHREVMKICWREEHILGPRCMLIVSQGSCCAYFLAVNASHSACLQLRIVLQSKSNHVHVACGSMDDVYILPPRSERICVAIVCDGREAHVSSVLYSYYSDSLSSRNDQSTPSQQISATNLDSSVGKRTEIHLSSDLLVSQVADGTVYQNGKGELCFCIEE